MKPNGFSFGRRPAFEIRLTSRILYFVFLLAAVVPASGQPSSISITYPEDGAVFPRDFAPPTVLWKDSNLQATAWLMEVSLPGRKTPIKFWSAGEKLQVGPIDSTLHGFVPPTLTAQESSLRTWKPDARTWAAIVEAAQQQPAILKVSGFRERNGRDAVSTGQAKLAISP